MSQPFSDTSEEHRFVLGFSIRTNPGNTGNNVINCYGSQNALYSAGASGCLAGNSFLHPVDAHDPRILQFGLKGSF